MNNRYSGPRCICACAVAALAGGLVTQQALAGGHNSEKTDKNAFSVKPTGKITPWTAMQIAANSTGGKPFSALYEFDEGKWCYGVMTYKNGKLSETTVDPTTGKVDETEAATPDGEAKEVKGDLNAILKLGAK